MSGLHTLQRAIACADDAKNEGNGYTLNLWLRSGKEVHGAVKELDTFHDTLVLELWERKKYNGYPRAGEPPQRTERIVQIDAHSIEMVEICW